MDGSAPRGTGQNKTDKIHHIAKVRVADSNPVSALEISSLAGLMRTNALPDSFHFSAHDLPITGHGWSDGYSQGLHSL
jgi:hypothetical protein